MSLEEFGYRQELNRSLGLFDLLAYGLVFIVPVAPVAVFGIVFNASRGMVPLVYLVGLFAMLFTALSYMSMSRAFPVAGSVYTYAARSIGPAVGFFSGWAILLDYLLIPALTYVVAGIAMHAALPETPKAVWVVVMLVAATGINYLGIEATARANFALLLFQLIVLALFAFLGGIALAHHIGGAHVSFAPFYKHGLVTPSLIFSALSLAVLSFLGFGMQAPTPSWGDILSQARSYIDFAWWLAFFPGLAILITIMSYNFVGEGLRDAVDPRLRVK